MTQPLRSHWSSILFGLRLLILVEVAALRGTVVLLGTIAYVGLPIAGPLTGLELFLLAFTIVVLTLLTERSTRRSSRDIQFLVEASRSENRTLIEENKTYWSEQTARLDNAVDALKKLAVLQ